MDSGDMYRSMSGAAGSRLFFSERDSDVAIRVEWEGQRWHFPGHRLVLCTMSEVFRAMLNAEMLEKTSHTITIRDTTPQAFKHFLRYLYIGIVEFNGWTDAVNVLRIAHKYSVQTLVNLCETYLINTVVFSNACTLHELAQVYCLKVLKKQTKSFIIDSAFIVSVTEGFYNLRSKSLEHFLDNTHLNIENEGSILSSLREWAMCECSRRCITLSKVNVLSVMEPFLKYIRWNAIPEKYRTFIPSQMIDKYKSEPLNRRTVFHIPASLQYHMNYVKFVVELGIFHERKSDFISSFDCMKFSLDNHGFLAGFRIIGLFRMNMCYMNGPSYLTLSRDDQRYNVQFNLHSLPWTSGVTVGRDVWREIIAYLPYPIRVDPFHTYCLSLKSSRSGKEMTWSKWPRTRLDSEIINSELGVVRFKVHGPCFGITQLFMFPAPPYRTVCNSDDC